MPRLRRDLAIESYRDNAENAVGTGSERAHDAPTKRMRVFFFSSPRAYFSFSSKTRIFPVAQYFSFPPFFSSFPFLFLLFSFFFFLLFSLFFFIYFFFYFSCAARCGALCARARVSAESRCN